MAFAHDLAEDVQVVFYDLGSKKNQWVIDLACQLKFGDIKRQYLSINEELKLKHFKKMLGYHGIKMIYLTKKDKNRNNLTAMVIFTKIKKENEIEGSYILQLKTEADHYLGVGDVGIQKYRGIGIGRFFIQMVKCYTYGVSTKSKSDVVLKMSRRENQKFLNIFVFNEWKQINICAIL